MIVHKTKDVAAGAKSAQKSSFLTDVGKLSAKGMNEKECNKLKCRMLRSFIQ